MGPAAIVLLAILAFGCGQDVSPTPSLAACGSLAATDCQAAMTAARLAQELDGAVIQAIRIVEPSAFGACPPSGGPPGAHICDVVAVASTDHGEIAFGLIRVRGGWVPSSFIR
jgi:hypothetical protein